MVSNLKIQEARCSHKHTVVLVDGQEICVLCCSVLNDPIKKMPLNLKPIHRQVLSNVIDNFPVAFNKNATNHYWSELCRYIREKRVWRSVIMGETRGGKSEIAQTESINYKRIFNKLFDLGHFDDINLSTSDDDINVQRSRIDFTVDNICSDATDYKIVMRDRMKKGSFVFGEKYVIDEDKESIGGVGSFSESVETHNLNNIVAKFMISETWIKPNQFLNRNTPYGLHAFLKDEKNKVNWCLVFKIEMKNAAVKEQTLIGWAAIGLHKEKKLRDAYDVKKNAWIAEEYEGKPNKRVQLRHDAAKVLSEDPIFSETTETKSGALRFVKTTEQQKVIVEKKMIEGVIEQFNEAEIERIVNHARLIVEEEKGKE